MSVELASLAVEFDFQPIEAGERALDKLAATSERAETATEQLGTAQAVLAAEARRAAQGLAGEVSSIQDVERSLGALRSSVDPAYQAQRRLDDEIREATGLYKAGAVGASDYARATSTLEGRMDAVARGQKTLAAAHTAGAKAAGLQRHELLNLGYQFQDIGVSLASGMNPAVVAAQQGSQVFQILSASGVKTGDVLRQLGSVVGGVATRFGPLIVAGAAFGGAFAIAAQQINAENKELIDTLGLTEKQLAKVKNQSVTMGDVMKGTFNAAAKALADAFGPEIDAVKSAFKSWYDELVANTVTEMKTIVGAFIGAFEAIKATWKMLPAAMGDAAILAVNLTLTAMEKMVNKAITMINGVIAGGNALAAKVGLNIAAPLLDQQSFARVSNQYEGALAHMAEAGTAAFQKGMAKGGKIVDSALGAITRETLQAYEARVRREAGEAGEAAKKPKAAALRDRTDERTAQIEGLVQAALADELQARLGVAREIEVRSDLERQIARVQEAVKAAQLDRQTANIANDRSLSEAKRAELTAQIDVARSINARAAAYREQAINQAAGEAKAREAFSIRQGEAEVQLRVLDSQEAIARYDFQRRDLSLERLKIEQELERAGLAQVTAANGATEAQIKIAHAMLDRLGTIHGRETQAAVGDFQDNFSRAGDAFGDLARSIESKDWDRAATSLIEAFGTMRQAFGQGGTMGGKIGAVGGVAGAAGQLIGGKVGGALSGAAGGAMAGAAFGPWGAAIGGVIGGVTSLLGGNKAEKARKNREAAAKAEAEIARVTETANQKRDIEIELLRAQGDATGALGRAREIALNATDASNRAALQQLHALQDVQTARDLEIRLMEASGNAIGALAANRAKERATVTAANWALLDQIFAMEDATTRVSDAKDALSAAVEREMSALEQSRDKFQSWADTLKAFSKDLYSGPQAMLSPEAQYLASKAAFDQTSTAAAGGDEEAIGDLQAVSQAYLEASKDYYASSKGYFEDLDKVRQAVAATQAYAQAQVSAADQQLVALHAQTDGILGVQAAVLSVRDALTAYQSAVSAQIAAAQTPTTVPGGAANDNNAGRGADWASYIANNSDVAAEYARNMTSAKGRAALAELGATSVEKWGEIHWNTHGKPEGRTPYATGGIMDRPITLGESGIGGEAGDEGILPLANVGGKMGVHATIGGNDELVKEVRGLRAELAEVKRELKAANVQRGAGTAELLDGVARLEKATKKVATETTRKNTPQRAA